MKKVLFVLFATLGMLYSCNDDNNNPEPPSQSEVTLFDKAAKPIAYINYADDGLTIYMWDGTPVAYFDGEEDIYHFNGQFLGWYVNHVLYNAEGYAVASEKGIVRGEINMNNTFAESVKGLKRLKPVPHVKSVKPVTPQFKDEWSVSINSLSKFFLMEITLFDKDKDATIYIDYSDDSTIYLWDGTPVAYLEHDTEVFHFDGRFLGWYKDGILYDKEGLAVGAEEDVLKGAISMIAPHVEPVKSMKGHKPTKEKKATLPEEPHFENQWSDTTLEDFFLLN